MKSNLRISLHVLKEQIFYFKKEIVILSVLTIFLALGNGVIPMVAGKFFDSLIEHDYLSIYGILLTPLTLLAIWFAIQTISALIEKKISYLKNVLGFESRCNYFKSCRSKLVNLPISFHKNTKLGEIHSNIIESANALDVLMGVVMVGLVPQILTIIVAFVIIFNLNLSLSLIILCAVIIYGFVLFNFSKPLNELREKSFEGWSESFGYAWDTIGNVRAIKHSVTEDYETKNISDRFLKYLINPYRRVFKIQSSLEFYQRSIIIITQLIIFFLSIYLVGNDLLTIGELFAFNAYTALVFGPFTILNSDLQFIQNAFIKIASAEKMIGNNYEIYNPEDEVKNIEIKGAIEFKNVYFQYEKESPVLKDVSFKVEPGQVIALVGESGVGKSTLIDLLAGYYFANKGEVIIDGVNIKRIGLKLLRRQIATVPQEVVLFNDTIKHNISYGNFDASDEQVEIASKKAHAYDFIMKFPDKWKQMVGERGVKLSVGQKQRVAIARAILRNPQILILDEPTSALDAGSENIISQSLEELMRGKTTFIIAHRLSTVKKADKILVFQ
ncbi:MAG: ABC transporter ATP-binding protein, partial [Patescibacteria group bacterium]|nr:ABC transporter ATP-binding protein [Patescibacteria group bacterium]